MGIVLFVLCARRKVYKKYSRFYLVSNPMRITRSEEGSTYLAPIRPSIMTVHLPSCNMRSGLYFGHAASQFKKVTVGTLVILGHINQYIFLT